MTNAHRRVAADLAFRGKHKSSKPVVKLGDSLFVRSIGHDVNDIGVLKGHIDRSVICRFVDRIFG
jgi:hypothetical protein